MAQQGVSNSGSGTTQARPVAQTTSSATGTKKPATTPGKRFIRTQAGAARYKKPIGTEIVATPRDQRGAHAQTDRESTDRYKGLVSGDPETQRKAMAGLTEDQLKRLSEVAFSFSSSDPNVARLRAGITLEMRQRGLDVNRYGGLAGRGSSGGKSGGASSGGSSATIKNWATGESYQVQTKGGKSSSGKSAAADTADERRALGEAVSQETKRRAAAAKAERDRLAAERKLAAQQAAAQRKQDALERARMSNQRRQSGKHTKVVRLSELDLAALDAAPMRKAVEKGQALPDPSGDRPGHFNIRNVGELRDAVTAFGRARPEDKEKIARFICKRAKALNAEHMLGEGIRKAAGYAETSLTRSDPVVVDLSGKWKHGWIPLDPAAVSDKTHGRSGGKKWWEGGAGPKSKARARYEAKAPDVIRHPTAKNVEYRKQDNGRYMAYENGKRSKRQIDQGGVSREEAARALQSQTRRPVESVESRGVRARNDRLRSGRSASGTKAAERLRSGDSPLPLVQHRPASQAGPNKYYKDRRGNPVGSKGAKQAERGGNRGAGMTLDQADKHYGTGKYAKNDVVPGTQAPGITRAKHDSGAPDSFKAMSDNALKQKAEFGSDQHKKWANAELDARGLGSSGGHGKNAKLDQISKDIAELESRGKLTGGEQSILDRLKRMQAEEMRKGNSGHKGSVTFVEPVTERKSDKPFASPATSIGRANLQQRTGKPQAGLPAASQKPADPGAGRRSAAYRKHANDVLGPQGALKPSDFRKYGHNTEVELEDNRGGRVRGKIKSVTPQPGGYSLIELETKSGAVHRYTSKNFKSINPIYT